MNTRQLFLRFPNLDRSLRIPGAVDATWERKLLDQDIDFISLEDFGS
jgi:hypothetical protein